MIQGLWSDMPSIYPGYFYLPAQLCLLMMSFETGLAIYSYLANQIPTHMALLIACINDYNGAAQSEIVTEPSTLPSDPPHDDKKPEDEDDKDYVPQPAASLALCHVVHAPERTSEYARRFCECVVLSYFSRSAIGKK
jgi:hypothetical protein